MTETLQPPKEWSAYAAPAPRDVRAALAALSEDDLLRLRAIARLRARSLPGDISWSDLLHEAVVRTLAGTRPWPLDVPLLAFLAGIMRSLCDEQWRRRRRQDALLTPGECPPS
jgi:RNA polymerase sigma-70 factor (ECF subfamily)